jgi:hypothetical protein
LSILFILIGLIVEQLLPKKVALQRIIVSSLVLCSVAFIDDLLIKNYVELNLSSHDYKIFVVVLSLCVFLYNSIHFYIFRRATKINLYLFLLPLVVDNEIMILIPLFLATLTLVKKFSDSIYIDNLRYYLLGSLLKNGLNLSNEYILLCFFVTGLILLLMSFVKEREYVFLYAASMISFYSIPVACVFVSLFYVLIILNEFDNTKKVIHGLKFDFLSFIPFDNKERMGVTKKKKDFIIDLVEYDFESLTISKSLILFWLALLILIFSWGLL